VASSYSIQAGAYEPTFESLRKREIPQWFQDAKFGIWSHWGPQSVPMYGDWYARHIYVEGSDQYRYHLAHYGHPSKVGYKDIVGLWKAENFDPDGLMQLYVDAGAKYFSGQCMHHDNFFNYASKLHRWNSVEMGPKKDITQLWKNAADKFNLPFCLTEHLAATYSWWSANKGCDKTGPYAGVPYDGNDPAYADFYLNNQDVYEERKEHYMWAKWAKDPGIFPWLAHKQTRWHEWWFECIKEVVDLYKPQMIYSDSHLPFSKGPNGEGLYDAGLNLVAHYYNVMAEEMGDHQAIYTQKSTARDVHTVGLLDVERTQLPEIADIPWQTDTSVGDWFYNVRDKYKSPGHVIEMLVDIISKNGCLLLNIPQRPDGTHDDYCVYILKEMAKWNAVFSEAVHSTRPFAVYGEGPSSVILDGFKEDVVGWSTEDIRFTQKQEGGKTTIYAFLMKWPTNGTAIIKSLGARMRDISKIRLLGGGELGYDATSCAYLKVGLPIAAPTEYTNCIAIEMN
jgi:alpha-L-fucosidase